MQQMQQPTQEPITLHGHQIALSGGRHVFYAAHDNYHYFRFRNEDAKITKIKLSGEVRDALVDLLTQPRDMYRWVLKIGDTSHDAITWEKV